MLASSTSTSNALSCSSVYRLLKAGASIGRIDAERMELIARTMLGVFDTQSMPSSGRSELNWNGSPLQLLFTIRNNRTGARLLSDPGFHLTDPAARYAIGRNALFSSLTLANAEGLRGIAEQTLADVLPPERDSLGRYAAGAMWLAVALGTPGAALYLAPDPQVARWAKAKEWASSITPAPNDALLLIEALQDCSFLLGVGIEGVGLESARFKIYWRMLTALPLSRFGIPLFLDPAMLEFLTQALDGQALAPNMLNFSANFDLVRGTLRDVKVDVSWHNRTRAEALQVLESQAKQLGMESNATHDTLDLIERLELEIGCIGLGFDAAGQYRINTYLFQQ